MTNPKKILAPFVLVALTACQAASGYGTDRTTEGPGGDYEKVSDLVELPDFIPGMGTLYVQPATLPAGPFLAYDREGDHVSTVYMIPLDALNEQAQWTDLSASGRDVRSVDVTYNPGHPGVDEPHYHVTLWHVAKDAADLGS